ncbi:MAG: nucleotidyl transferase AbiEii/AbiGii toxin family protein [Candidatus Paceibacterota bacterium]
MLDISAIEKYYPENERAFKRNILREYLQYKILEIIFHSDIGRNLVFLGGTALRIVHGNTRFSEDLDFDNFDLSEDEFTALTEEIKKELELEGNTVEIKNVFKGAYRSYIRLPEVLFKNELSDLREEKIMIQVDTVPQAFEYEKERTVLNKFDVFTQVYVTPLDLLLSQKIYAALNRSRMKGRDFFDITFLLPKTKPNYRYLEDKLGISNGSDLKEVLLSKLSDTNFEDLADDVEPFLINPRDSEKVEQFIPYIKSVDL